MTFIHKPLDLPPISSEDTPDGRYYETPGGRFPSVTTVIGRWKGDAWLNDWRDRVGEDQARRTGVKAKLRGTAVHLTAERYLRGEPDWSRGQMPTTLDSFAPIRRILDERVDEIYGIEVPLWSPVLRTAGRTDLVARWDGVPAIVDFKTSKRSKKEDDVLGYFLQETCYGVMLEERTGVHAPLIVTLMMVDNEPPIVWMKRRCDYEELMRRVFSETTT